MIWTILLIIIVVIIGAFLVDLNKDNNDLSGLKLEDKFSIVVNLINDAAFDGNGTITRVDKREFRLYQTGKNQIVIFLYSTGHLTIKWRYKYFQKEIVHEKQFSDVRNLSIFEQQRIAETMISEMDSVVMAHQRNVLGNI